MMLIGVVFYASDLYEWLSSSCGPPLLILTNCGAVLIYFMNILYPRCLFAFGFFSGSSHEPWWCDISSLELSDLQRSSPWVMDIYIYYIPYVLLLPVWNYRDFIAPVTGRHFMPEFPVHSVPWYLHLSHLLVTLTLFSFIDINLL